MELLGMVYLLCWLVAAPFMLLIWLLSKAWGTVAHYAWAKKAAVAASKLGVWFDWFDKTFRI